MTVEVATTIDDLNASLPSATDPKSEGDDHIRLIKTVVKSNTLRNVNPSYTGTLTGGTGVINIGSGQFYKDAAGNFGLGVTPSAFGGGYKGFQIGGNPVITGANAPDICGNAYHDGANWRYIGTNAAARYSVNNSNGGTHAWYTAPSGTAGNPISFTTAMTLDASGNLLVGTTSGTNHVLRKDAPSAYVAAVTNISATAPNGLIVETAGTSASGGYFLDCYNQSGMQMRVASTGNLTNTNNSYGAISDLKLKENITDVSPKLAKLLKVRIVNYTLKADPDKTKLIGVIAQELEQISPGLVEETPDYEEVKKTREVTKTVAVAEKTLVKREQKTTEVVGGKAIVKTEWIEELADVPVIDHFPLFDESGQPVLEVDTPEVPAVTDADGNVTHPAVPATYRQARHSVPRMHEVTEIETYTERVPTGTVTKSVKYSVFLPMLIKGMQEQQAQIEAMQSQIDEQNTAMQLLTARLEALEAK